MTPKVSVIVTCYDLGAYLQEALDSIPEKVGGVPCEVIIVDDGSTDAMTREVIAALDRSRYRIIEQPNMGLGKARNNGIAIANGEYIIPLDADNRLDADGVAAAVALLESNPATDIVYGNARYFGDRNELWEVAEYDFKRLLRKNYVDACACFRRSVWERLGGYDEHMPFMGWEDWDFWLRASVAGMQFRHLGRLFFDYRVRGGSMIADARNRSEELTAYIFSKPGLRFLGPLRAEYITYREVAHKSLGIRGPLRLIYERLRGRK